jgi:nucleotide-binding universal stress UspA family protein
MWEPGRHRWSKPNSILVSTDLADINRLFPIALTQAKESGARLILLHVLTTTNAIAVDPGGLPYYNPSEAIAYTEKFLATYAAEAHEEGLVCEVLVREGSAPQQILATAQQLHVDRVLLGTRSRSKWGKLLLGSVAEQVLRSVPVPVVTVGPEAHQSAPAADHLQTILHATSLSKASRPSAALACELAQMSASRLVLMHVLPTSGPASFTDEHVRGYAERELQHLIPEEAPTWCKVETVITSGSAATEILAQARAVHADLIVLGAAKGSALATLTRDGTVYRVLAHAPCPVLTLCSPAESGVRGKLVEMSHTAAI